MSNSKHAKKAERDWLSNKFICGLLPCWHLECQVRECQTKLSSHNNTQLTNSHYFYLLFSCLQKNEQSAKTKTATELLIYTIHPWFQQFSSHNTRGMAKMLNRLRAVLHSRHSPCSAFRHCGPYPNTSMLSKGCHWQQHQTVLFFSRPWSEG